MSTQPAADVVPDRDIAIAQLAARGVIVRKGEPARHLKKEEWEGIDFVKLTANVIPGGQWDAQQHIYAGTWLDAAVMCFERGVRKISVMRAGRPGEKEEIVNYLGGGTMLWMLWVPQLRVMSRSIQIVRTTNGIFPISLRPLQHAQTYFGQLISAPLINAPH